MLSLWSSMIATRAKPQLTYNVTLTFFDAIMDHTLGINRKKAQLSYSGNLPSDIANCK